MIRIILLFFSVFLTGQKLFSQENNAEIIKFETNYTISSDKILTKEIFVVIQINNRAGEKFTKISIPYSKNVPVTNLKAQLQTPSGYIIRKLKKKEITDKSDISNGALYEDDYIKTFTLKHNSYPYQITYSYKKTYKNFFIITHWSPVIDYEIPTKNAILSLTKPSDYKIFIDKNNISEQTSEYKGKFIKYTWTSQYLKILKHQSYSPAISEIVPNVTIAPETFTYGIPGKQSSWIEFGNWVADLNNGLDEIPEYEKKNIDELIKSLQTDKQKINTLYKYLQKNTRYINVSIDIGGYKPHPASYVAKNKYGDCKALTNYMKAILSYAGIKSYYTLIHADEKITPLNRDFTTSQFNHVILMIPNAKDTVWLECTSKFAPAGYLGTFTQGRYALAIKKNNSELVKTPELKIEDTEELRTVEFNIQNDGTCKANIKLNVKGYEYEYLKSFSNLLNDKQKNRFIHDFISFNNYELIKWTIEKQDDSEASVCLNLNLKIKDYVKTYDDFKYINLLSTEIPHFEKPKKRSQKVCINYPINKKDSLIYNNIEDYKYKQIKDTSIISKYGKFTFSSKEINGKIIINKQFILFSGEYPLSEYKSFYNFLNSVRNIEHHTSIIYLKKN